MTARLFGGATNEDLRGLTHDNLQIITIPRPQLPFNSVSAYKRPIEPPVKEARCITNIVETQAMGMVAKHETYHLTPYRKGEVANLDTLLLAHVNFSTP